MPASATADKDQLHATIVADVHAKLAETPAPAAAPLPGGIDLTPIVGPLTRSILDGVVTVGETRFEAFLTSHKTLIRKFVTEHVLETLDKLVRSLEDVPAA